MEYAVVTGASTGIGFAIARLLAKKGYSLVLVAQNKERLLLAEERIKKETKEKVITYALDLSKEESAKEVLEFLKKEKISVSMLINNAGIGMAGEFTELDSETMEKMMVLNMITLTRLTKGILPDMYERGRGYVLNVASNGAFFPGPYVSAYYATKAYVLSLSEALHYEAKKHGIGISVLCPGATKTMFFKRSNKAMPKTAMDPAQTARIAYKGLVKNKKVIVPGLPVKLLRLVPKRVKIIAVARIQKSLIQRRIETGITV